MIIFFKGMQFWSTHNTYVQIFQEHTLLNSHKNVKPTCVRLDDKTDTQYMEPVNQEQTISFKWST